MKLKTVMMHVGEDHLEKGDPGLVSSCPVYLSLESMLNLPESLFHPMNICRDSVIYYDVDYARILVLNSKRLQNFIWRIDMGKHVSPTSFRVRVPEKWLKIVD